MGRKLERLMRRGAVYYLRVRVPDDLREFIGRTEIRRSLGTSDPAEARRLVRIESLKVDGEFAAARRALLG